MQGEKHADFDSTRRGNFNDRRPSQRDCTWRKRQPGSYWGKCSKEVSVHREEIYQRIQHERAMHEHLQHIDQDYQPSSYEDDNQTQNNFNR